MKVKVLRCQWCEAEFSPPEQPKVKGKAPTFRPLVLEHADHEVRCEQNPDRPEKGKMSKAWNPTPWKAPHVGARPVPRPHLLTFINGPYDGRQTPLVNYLVDGSTVAVEPPRRMSGPVMEDSKGRAGSRFMGHYELQISNGCPVYKWVDTIHPKKRLGEHPAFVELYPEIAAELDTYVEFTTEAKGDADE